MQLQAASVQRGRDISVKLPQVRTAMKIMCTQGPSTWVGVHALQCCICPGALGSYGTNHPQIEGAGGDNAQETLYLPSAGGLPFCILHAAQAQSILKLGHCWSSEQMEMKR